LARVRDETGLRIDIISSREEAELALESCAPLMRGIGRRALVFDIGGGSTELGWVRLPPDGGPPELIGYVSLPLGVVNLAERFGADAFHPATYELMVADVLARLVAFESVHCIGHEIRNGDVAMLGTSGTVTTLAGIALDLPRYSRAMVDGVALPGAAARAAVERLRALGRVGLSEHPCVGPERAEFVLPGCAVFSAIHRLWPAAQVVVADRGLREGILMRMIRGDRGGRAPRREFRAPPRPVVLPGAGVANGQVAIRSLPV
jgi:exopolyphosphatase/guanosine-5'-triphosphate,3'-diphosphate pyrophosphatase